MARIWWLILLLFMMAPVRAGADAQEPEHIHVLRPGETVWSISRALLAQPDRWLALKKHNRVRRDREMPVGSPVRIPMSWLKRLDLPVEVLRVSGEVRWSRPGETATQALAAGGRLRSGERVITGPQSYATLRVPDGSIVRISQESTVVVRAAQVLGGPATEILFAIERGRVETQVTPRADPDSKFEIRTPAAQLGVRGTRFRVALSPDGKRSLAEVESGKVAAANHTLPGSPAVDLDAGFGSVVREGQPPLPPIALLAPADLRSVDGIELGPDFDHTFEGIRGAVAYRVQLATDAAFDRLLTERILPTPSFRFSRLPEGRYHLRVRAVDANELEGRETRISFMVRDLDV